MAVSRRDGMNHADTERRLGEMTRALDEKKRDLARLEGEKRQLLSSLKEFGCKSVDDAVALLKKIEGDIVKIEERLAMKMKALEKYDWED